jgi:hypothetical protein
MGNDKFADMLQEAGAAMLFDCLYAEMNTRLKGKYPVNANIPMTLAAITLYSEIQRSNYIWNKIAAMMVAPVGKDVFKDKVIAHFMDGNDIPQEFKDILLAVVRSRQ